MTDLTRPEDVKQTEPVVGQLDPLGKQSAPQAKVLLQQLTFDKQRDIARFLDANRNRTKVDETTHFKLTKELMDLLEFTPLQNSDRKLLVTALYNDVAADDTNKFNATFNISEAIEILFDTSQHKYGVKVNKKGCFASLLPCCSSVSVVYNVKNHSLSLNAEPLVNTQ